MVPTNMSVTETIKLEDQAAAVNLGKAFYSFTDDHNDTHHQSKNFFSYQACGVLLCAPISTYMYYFPQQ